MPFPSFCRRLLPANALSAFVLLIGGALAAGVILASKVQAQSLANGTPPVTAALPDAGFTRPGTELSIPRPLSAADADRYQAIFRAQAKADWKNADRILSKLHDQRLVGHILAERYLHAHYKTSYRELADWLKTYADYPQAARIYKLALKKKPKGAKAPNAPASEVSASRRVVNPDLFGEEETPEWQTGMEAWRRGDYTRAAQKFAAVATASDGSSWLQSAGAYWAARAELKNRRPQQVTPLLQAAAGHPRTFYGQLARRALGMASGFSWTPRPMTGADRDLLLRAAVGQRAFALMQIGQTKLAEDEFLLFYRKADAATAEALLTVAQQLRMPAFALRVGAKTARNDIAGADAALYPVPNWEPKGGFAVNRALLYAVMRQESGFEPTAESHKGATGLMQIMPRTASYIAKKSGLSLGQSKKDLMNPETNLALAQSYMERILADEAVKGDLFLLAASYNAGPGRVAEWKDSVSYEDDPLLFLESIPYRETRYYVQRVLSNFWIYQERLGEHASSLDQLASGASPLYKPAQ